MSVIHVNARDMLHTASRIENYISEFDRNMGNIDNTVAALGSDWQGVDYDTFKREWTEMYHASSVSGKMRTALQNYAGAVREAAKRYREAQARANRRAHSL